MTSHWTDDGYIFLCILVSFRQIFIRSLRLLHSHKRLQNIRQKKSLAKKIKPSTTAHSVLKGNRQGMVMYLFNYMRHIRPLNANYHWCEWMTWHDDRQWSIRCIMFMRKTAHANEWKWMTASSHTREGSVEIKKWMNENSHARKNSVEIRK